MSAFLIGLVEFSRRHAIIVLLAVLAFTGAAGFYAVRTLDINTDTSKMLSPELEWRKQAAAFDREFPHMSEATTIVLDGISADAVEDGTKALAAALRQRPDLLRSVRTPDSGPFFETYGLLFLSVDELSALSDKIAEAQPLLGPLAADPSLRGLFGVLGQALTGLEQGEATGDKLVHPLSVFARAVRSVVDGKPVPVDWGSLMTGQAPRPEQLRHFIVVQPVLDTSALLPGARASAAIRAAAASLHLAEAGVRIRLTGEVPLEDDELQSVMRGAGAATALTAVAVVVILLLGLRAPRLILAIMVTVVVGLIATAAFAAAAVGTLNMVSVAFAVLFIGIGVDFGIQFSMRYRAELYAVTGGAAPADRSQANAAALSRAARAIVGPLGLAALATAIGFFSFIPTSYSGVSQLGEIAGTSMLVALLANLTVLPALLSLLQGHGAPEPAGFAWAAPIDRWLAAHARPVMVVALIAGAVAGMSVPFVQFDSDPLDLRDPHTESVSTALELAHDPLTSPYAIDVLRPDLAAAEALGVKLSALPEVKMTLSLASFVPDDQAAKLDILSQMQLFLGPVLDPGPAQPLPSPDEERQAVAAFLSHLQAFLKRPQAASLGAAGPDLASALQTFLAMPHGGDVGALSHALLAGLGGRLDELREAVNAAKVSPDTMPADFKADWIAADGRARLQVFAKGNAKDERQMARFVAAVRAVAPDATGPPVSILESGRTVSDAFRDASAYAVIAIGVALTIVLRRLRDAALVMAPLILAGLYALGTCVALGFQFNYANVIAVPLLMGIGVAFDIYFVMAWRREHGPVALLQTSTARAVVFSACTTGTAFGSLALSHHVGTASMGILLMLTLFYVVLCTLFVQPALMTLWGRQPDA